MTKSTTELVYGEKERTEALLNMLEDLETEKRKLQESESKNQALIRAMPDLMFLLDRNGVFLDYHASSQKLLFQKPGDFLGRNIRQIMPPTVVKNYLSSAEQAIKTGNIHIFEYSLPIADDVHYFEARVSTCGQDKILIIIRDITERKNAEHALAKANAELETRVKERTRELQFLYDAAEEFVDFPAGKDIYKHIGEKIREIGGDCIVIVNSFDPLRKATTTRAMVGLGSGLNLIMGILGKNPVGKEYPLDQNAIDKLKSGQLEKIAGGVKALSPDISPRAATALEKTLNLGDLYGMGFAREGSLYGNIVIMLHKGRTLQNADTVRAFSQQAAMVLQRIVAERKRVEEEVRGIELMRSEAARNITIG